MITTHARKYSHPPAQMGVVASFRMLGHKEMHQAQLERTVCVLRFEVFIHPGFSHGSETKEGEEGGEWACSNSVSFSWRAGLKSLGWATA